MRSTQLTPNTQWSRAEKDFSRNATTIRVDRQPAELNSFSSCQVGAITIGELVEELRGEITRALNQRQITERL